MVGWGGLFDYSVKSGTYFVKVKARFGLVDQVGQDKDHISQGQGQELDNFTKIVKKSFIMLFINIELKTEL